jgi:hypothetical protein
MAVSDQVEPGSGRERLHGPFWRMPKLYGEAEAFNSMGAIAAPLLAGFSLAAMVQTLTIKTSDARWPGVALLLFMLAAVLFVFSVQAMFWARGYQTTPAEIKAWWPDAADPQRLNMLRDQQRWHAKGFSMWANRARVTYNTGLLCLLAALTVLAVPAGSDGHVAFVRWLAVAVGGAALIAEATWIIGSSPKIKWLARLLQPPLDDASDTFSASSVPGAHVEELSELSARQNTIKGKAFEGHGLQTPF